MPSVALPVSRRSRVSGDPATNGATHPAPLTDALKRVARSHNLTDGQWNRIVSVLGRLPTITEVGMFGVLWAEHCSYCSSKPYLKMLPKTGARILVPAGTENAGVVDIGDGLGVAFKVESHNHPSAVEPVQGAATGVGGILRDIFTMGARPIALLDSLRFGPPGEPRGRFLLEGVVKGIADLHRWTVDVRAVGQLTGSEAGPAQSVAAGGRTDVDDGVANSTGRSMRQRLPGQDADAHDIDQWIVLVRIVKRDFPSDSGNPDRIPVICNALDYTVQEKSRPGMGERPEPQ